MSGRIPLRRRLKRFAPNSEGAAAVEFAMIVGPFLFMIFAVLELALVFLLSSSLDTASERAARRIRTGEVQTAGEGKEAFKTALCQGMSWLANNCSTALKVDVRTFQQFPDTNLADSDIIKDCKDPKDPTKTYKCMAPESDLLFNAGGPTDVVVVRTYYQWPLLTPFLSQALSRLHGNVAVIQSTQTFRNEPYA